MRVTAPPPLHPLLGEAAPDVLVARVPDAAEFTLAALWQDGPAVLVFLRHLGCTFCREHVAQLRLDTDAFARHNARVALITVGKPDDTAHFCADRAPNATFLCLSDADKRAYQAYGLSRTTPRDLFLSPHLYARGFQATLHGHFVGMPKGDPFQMPGVFIVEPGGIVRYAHRHKDAADNPPNADLLAVLETIQNSQNR